MQAVLPEVRAYLLALETRRREWAEHGAARLLQRNFRALLARKRRAFFSSGALRGDTAALDRTCDATTAPELPTGPRKYRRTRPLARGCRGRRLSKRVQQHTRPAVQSTQCSRVHSQMPTHDVEPLFHRNLVLADLVAPPRATPQSNTIIAMLVMLQSGVGAMPGAGGGKNVLLTCSRLSLSSLLFMIASSKQAAPSVGYCAVHVPFESFASLFFHLHLPSPCLAVGHQGGLAF